MDATPRLMIGAMSGTSADGVDAALIRINGRGVKMTAELIGHFHHPYESTLAAKIWAIRSAGAAPLSELAKLGQEISQAYAIACRALIDKTGVEPGKIAAIAAHGQTLFHDPPCTIQWFDPSLLAWETGCAVVSDFRRPDCAAGGQGAPLVPFADYILFRDETKSRVILNIGGIANLTFLRAGAPIEETIAFDTGPGNCISDHLVRSHSVSNANWDLGGEIAARGLPIGPIIQNVLSNEYFSRPPPKSTDGPAMIRLFAEAVAKLRRNDPPENLIRSACAVTSETIHLAMRQFCDPFPDEIIVSGGGVHNKELMRLLRQKLGPIPISTTDENGLPGDAKEAVAFALLGAATLDGEASNVPNVTGANRRVVLGSITPAGKLGVD